MTTTRVASDASKHGGPTSGRGGSTGSCPGRPVLWALACDGADGVRDLLTGMTGDLAHAMALAGARTLAGIAGVTGPHDSA